MMPLVRNMSYFSLCNVNNNKICQAVKDYSQAVLYQA